MASILSDIDTTIDEGTIFVIKTTLFDKMYKLIGRRNINQTVYDFIYKYGLKIADIELMIKHGHLIERPSVIRIPDKYRGFNNIALLGIDGCVSNIEFCKQFLEKTKNDNSVAAKTFKRDALSCNIVMSEQLTADYEKYVDDKWQDSWYNFYQVDMSKYVNITKN